MVLMIKLSLIKPWKVIKKYGNGLKIKAAIPPNLGFRAENCEDCGYAMIILKRLSKGSIIGNRRQIMGEGPE